MLLTVFYITILMLIVLVDIKHRRILNLLALPATIVALVASLLESSSSFFQALAAAALGFLFFYFLYWLGARYYGSAALGFGDVKLAMLLGAILGLDKVMLALAGGMLLAGLYGLFLLVTGLGNRQTTLPYGSFLAIAGIVFLAGAHIN